MKKRYSRIRVNTKTSHSDSMLRNMLLSLLENGKVVTTLNRAKMLKRYADKELSYAVKSAMSNPKQQVTEHSGHSKLSKRLLQYRSFTLDKKLEPNGSFTSSVNVGFRAGDNARTLEIGLLSFQEFASYLDSNKPKKKPAKKVTTQKTLEVKDKKTKTPAKAVETQISAEPKSKQAKKTKDTKKSAKKKSESSDAQSATKPAVIPQIEKRENFFSRIGGRILGRRVQGPNNQKGRSTARSGI